MNAARPARPPRVLAILPAFMPATETLAVKPLLALNQAGLVQAEITLEVFATARQVARADLVVFCRNIEPGSDFLLQAARRLGRRVIYDLDDDFFDVPVDTEEGRYYRGPARLAQLERYLRAANLVRVHSPTLKARVAEFNPNIVQVGSPLYWDLIADLPTPPRQPDRLKIVYMTGRIYDILASIFVTDARRILERYGAQVELHCWGFHPPELRGHPGVRLVKLVTDYDRHMRRFYRQGYDIGLAPLLDDTFHRSKTDTKFREYGACRVAGIYSAGEVYSNSVQDGETGLLVPNEPGAWYAAMARLIEEGDLRAKIQEQAQQYVRQHYAPADFHQGWWAHIQQALQAGQPQPAASPAPASAGPRRPAAGGWAGRARRLVERARRQGLASAWYTLGWYRHNLWALLRLRRQLAQRGNQEPNTHAAG